MLQGSLHGNCYFDGLRGGHLHFKFMTVPFLVSSLRPLTNSKDLRMKTGELGKSEMSRWYVKRYADLSQKVEN